MSARKGQPNAVLEQVARIPLVLSAASALWDTKVMGKIATMKMSALVVSIVIWMQIAETPMALIHAVAIPASMVMVFRVMMWMSAEGVSMIVMQKLNAGIPGDHTVAPVLKDIMEMAGSVRVSRLCF